MDAIEDLDRAGLEPARPTERVPRMSVKNDHGIGLDGGADADEAAALLEVRLEIRALSIGQRTRHAGVEEHDGAVGIEIGGRELGADGSGSRRVHGVDAAGAGRCDRRDTGVRQRIGRARDDEHLVWIRRSRLDPCRRIRRHHQSQAHESQPHNGSPHTSPPCDMDNPTPAPPDQPTSAAAELLTKDPSAANPAELRQPSPDPLLMCRGSQVHPTAIDESCSVTRRGSEYAGFEPGFRNAPRRSWRSIRARKSGRRS